MNILITGARGFMGRNLRHTLAAIQPENQLYLIDKNSTLQELEEAARNADFVVHLAGVNRTRDPAELMQGNADFTQQLMDLLEKGKQPPVWLPSSIQAEEDHPYGQSKRAAEETVRAYGERTGAQIYICRLPNVFGKWSQPNDNSAVATFCYNAARDLPITVNDPDREMKLVYIDDVINECMRAIYGAATEGENGFCCVNPVYSIVLSDLAQKIESFCEMRKKLDVPDQSDPFTAKLYATYLSFLPEYDLACPTVTHSDHRGSFTELIHMAGHGQVSVNVSKPHITKGEHWHQTKHEKFIVLSGEGVIRFRRPEEETVISYRVSGDVLQVIDIPPGFTHNIENTGDTDMITLMWANEVFDPGRLDTYPLPVDPAHK